MIAFACPGCGKQLNVKDEFAGKNAACPQCKKRLTVPTARVPAGAVQPRPAHPPAAATVAQANNTLSQADACGENLSFLAPPQKPDELGRLGSYRVLKVLGAGGMGMVLLAEDPVLKRHVALKVMKPELAAKEVQRQRFLREAQATAAIDHDHIVAIIQVGEERGVPYIAMPFLKGESLDDRLKREGRLPVAEAVRIGRQVAEGLAAAHERGLIHRDIKPGNIWLEAPKGRAKIVDFGLARTVDDDVQLTKTGTILGTPAYMAPEQASSKPVDGRTDLYSLGAMLYRMLTGELPFKGADTMAVLLALALETPRPVRELNPEVPQPLADLVMQLLAKDPKQRPASAQAVVDALAALGDDRTQMLDGRTGAGAPLPRAAKGANALLKLVRTGGRLGLVITGTAALIVVGLVLFFLLRPGGGGAVVKQTAPAGPAGGEKEITNSIGMKLVYIPSGKFKMGSTAEEIERFKKEPHNWQPGRWDQLEGPQHEVRITTGFYIGIHEVKQSEYEKVMGKNPSHFKDSPDHPVEQVIWDEAAEFCKKLSEQPDEKKSGRVYRLPTEAEWEYACRAGTTTTFHYGNSLSSKQASFDGKTVKCGSYQPNAWGLFNMHGNVREWCLDGPRPYTPNAVEDPRGPETAGGARVLRGGCWFTEAWHCRSALRDPDPPSYRNNGVGFRVVCVLPRETITNSIGMKLVLIPAGEFSMGSPDEEDKREGNEGPQHKVKITKAFYLGVYEVRQSEYEKLSKNLSMFKDPGNPAENVTWDAAVDFCNKLSELPDEKKTGRKYRLPTEAEWEYACRAGTTTVFHYGNSLSSKQANFEGHQPYGGAEPGPTIGKTIPCGSYDPNRWGLFDMHGNVWEWCLDDGRTYTPKAVEDPRGSEAAGGPRVLRGGSWREEGFNCRAARRYLGTARTRLYGNAGFRVVCVR